MFVKMVEEREKNNLYISAKLYSLAVMEMGGVEIYIHKDGYIGCLVEGEYVEFVAWRDVFHALRKVFVKRT